MLRQLPAWCKTEIGSGPAPKLACPSMRIRVRLLYASAIRVWSIDPPRPKYLGRVFSLMNCKPILNLCPSFARRSSTTCAQRSGIVRLERSAASSGEAARFALQRTDPTPGQHPIGSANARRRSDRHSQDRSAATCCSSSLSLSPQPPLDTSATRRPEPAWPSAMASPSS